MPTVNIISITVYYSEGSGSLENKFSSSTFTACHLQFLDELRDNIFYKIILFYKQVQTLKYQQNFGFRRALKFIFIILQLCRYGRHETRTTSVFA